jgi:hypothetical protein
MNIITDITIRVWLKNVYLHQEIVDILTKRIPEELRQIIYHCQQSYSFSEVLNKLI